MNKVIVLALFVGICCGASHAQDSNGPSYTDPSQVVREFLTAYMKGDHAKFTSLLHPEVVWMQPGVNRISGVKKSREELLKMGAKMAELSAGTVRLVNVTYYETHGNTVACILHWKAAQPSGRVLDVENIDVYTVEDGKIIQAKIFSRDIEQENRFWGK